MTFLLLDDARAQHARLYQQHIRRDTLAAHDLVQLDALLARGWQEKLHAGVRIPYEFGLALHGLAEHAPPLILDWYARLSFLDGQAIDDWLATQDDHAPAGLANLHVELDENEHAAVIARIHEHIRAGDSYQINHTLRLYADAYGQPAALYRRLRRRQPAPYAAYAYHPDDGHTLCLSPELFLQRHGEHLHTLPMKGTAPATGDIAAAKHALQQDPKNRAENLMIVDLLRNDLSRIARPFGVSVSDPFHVEQHGGVLQMTSRVNARLREHISHADILAATYPCGSITGAPKHITMQLIAQLEPSPRGLYTGALGYIEREHFCLNVAIRTLCLKQRRATFGVGAGITIDSRAADEYREYQLKAAFLQAPPEFSLIETLRVDNGVAQYLDAHLARLAASAHSFAIPCPTDTIRAHIHTLSPATAPQRLKITLHPDGSHELQLAPLDPLPDAVTLLLHPEALPDHDLLRRHKTTHRAHLDRAWQHAVAHGAFDSLLFNQRGELLEGGRSSVFVQIDNAWHTPPLDLDILPGIQRAQLLAHPRLIHATRIHETVLTRDDLARAQAFIVANSLRGILPATLQQ